MQMVLKSSQFLIYITSHCKNIHKIYGRIIGNQLPVPVPLFLREPVKNISHGRTG